VEPREIRLPAAISTIETLIAELGHPDEHRVIYAIELLDALDRRHPDPRPAPSRIRAGPHPRPRRSSGSTRNTRRVSTR
jgi:hypothetical protein